MSWEDPLEEETETHSSILAWRIRGQRCLQGCGSCDHKELDTTKRLSTHTHNLAINIIRTTYNLICLGGKAFSTISIHLSGKED